MTEPLAPTTMLPGAGGLPVDAVALAELLGADRVVDVATTAVDYDLHTITTASRTWVTGTAERHGVREPFRLVAKVAHAADRSPVWPFIPPGGRALTLAMLDWRIEPAVYASDLATRLPPGLTMPHCYGVSPVDDGSAVIWLEAVAHEARVWTDLDLARAARVLGRFAGSAAVAQVADRVGHPHGPVQARSYWEGRLSMQFGTAYRDPGFWRHPVLTAEVDGATRDRLLGLLDAAPTLVEQTEELPLLSGHGDACANNLLLSAAEIVAIDWAFFSRIRLGFDLTQLVTSDIDLGRVPASSLRHRQHIALPAYAAGLADEGVDVDPDDLRRAHAVQLALAAGIPTIPIERLDEDPAVLVPVLRERLALLDGILAPLGL